ncbi:hypothetical protein FP76_gp138 [Bacillus phage Evoli]|uniref:Uncharacterized protein n=1 Tax=Bacillus phage Evoli TaxID=1486658 RepID=A0A024B191_9CAUD|nr:hypothetical protein FP76_gp138 [Bacillus phage Evoli]AHZ09956.1 hypothetical protein [Bacillus phage Evoli]
MIVVNSIGLNFLFAPDNIRLIHSIIVSTTTIPTDTPLNPKLIVVNHSLSNKNSGVLRISPAHKSYIQDSSSADIFAILCGNSLIRFTNSPNQSITSFIGFGVESMNESLMNPENILLPLSKNESLLIVSAYALSPIEVKKNVEITAAGIVPIFRSLDLRSLNF